MPRIDLDSQKLINRKIARLPVVKDEVRAGAHRVAIRAEGLLAGHRRTGQGHIEVRSNLPSAYGHIDSDVAFVHPAALYIEFGHDNSGWYADVPGAVDGLAIMRRAAGLR